MMTWIRIAAVAALVLVPHAGLAAGPQRAPTTDKDRRRIVELAERLESEPLAKNAKKDRQKALTLIGDAPDLRVAPCRALLGELLFAKRLEAQQLYVQLQISTAKYIVENPDAAGDRERALAGGLEGVLRTYDAMHHTNPSLTIPFVDELVERRTREGLDGYVRDALVDCDR
jgi:hypothetical protein